MDEETLAGVFAADDVRRLLSVKAAVNDIVTSREKLWLVSQGFTSLSHVGGIAECPATGKMTVNDIVTVREKTLS